MCVIAVASSGAIDRISIFGERFSGGIGIVFVTSSRDSREPSSRSMARPDSTGCTTAADTLRAP